MWPGRRRAALADDLLDLAAHGLERDAEALEGLGGDAFALVDQPEQDVLGADVGVVQQARFLLGEDDDPAGPVGESFEHVRPFQWGPTSVQCTGEVRPTVTATGGSRPERSGPACGRAQRRRRRHHVPMASSVGDAEATRSRCGGWHGPLRERSGPRGVGRATGC